MLRGKIHRATITEADLHYVGSLTVDADLLRAAHKEGAFRVERDRQGVIRIFEAGSIPTPTTGGRAVEPAEGAEPQSAETTIEPTATAADDAAAEGELAATAVASAEPAAPAKPARKRPARKRVTKSATKARSTRKTKA